MTTKGSRFSSIAVIIISFSVITRAFAENSGAPATEAKPDVTLPRLIRVVEAKWPNNERVRENVSTLLEVTISETGKVVNAVVVESAGEPFDLAAIAAVYEFQFEPARRGNTNLSARVRYRYVFKGPPIETSPEVPQVSPEVPGVLTETSPQSLPKDTNTDKTQVLDASASSETNTVEPLLDESYQATAEIAAPPREVTRRTIAQEDLTKIPGTSGDALRAIEVMPGVARTSISSGDPLLRGAAWHESRSYIEGTTVPLLFHFGGVKSVFNSQLLERVDLYPSNYSARYGRSVGGVVAAKVRDPRRDKLHVMADVSVIDSMALFETPINDNVAIAIAARRSNIGFFYDTFAKTNDFSVVAVPTYYDYQGIGSLRLSSHHQLRVLAYGSRDSLRLDFANPSDFDPGLRDKIDYAIGYQRVQTSLDSELTTRLTQRVQLTYGHTQMRQMFGLTRAELREHDLFSRGEWNYRAADSVQINVGLDLEASTLSGYYVGSRPPQAEGGVNNGGVSTEKIVDASSLARVNAIRPGLYTEFEWRPLASLVLVPAIRIDHYTDQDAWTFDPRLACRYELTEELRLKWGLGIYSQNPQYYELLKNLGNPKLSPYHAQQFSTGFEHHPDSKLNWGIEGFYKNLTHRVVATNGGQKPYFVNDGTGRIYGVELFTQYTGHRLRGWLAYTLSRSERRDRNDAVRLFEADQTHILAITANYELGRGWELGSRFRVTSGNPYTPVTSAVYDANVDVYQPVNAKPFSARNPPFHQLDVRIEKTFSFKMWKLSTYLDVQNAYNAKNYQGFDYSYNYGERRRIEGLSLIPNLGVRGEI